MSQGASGRTRIIIPCTKVVTKGVDGFVEAIFFLIGCGERVTKVFDGSLEIRYFLV